MRRRSAEKSYTRLSTARRRPLVPPCQTLITGNKLENRDCHNPGNESGVSSERRCRLSSLSTAISRYINADGERRRRHERARRRPGRVPYLELACLRIIDFLLIGYLPADAPLRPSSPALPCAATSLLPIIIQLGSAGPGSNGRDALRVLLAACNLSARLASPIFPRESDRSSMMGKER